MADPKKQSDIPWFWVILLFVTGLWPIALVILLLHYFEKKNRKQISAQMEGQPSLGAKPSGQGFQSGSWKWMKPVGVLLAVVGVRGAVPPIADLIGGYYVEFEQLLISLGLLGAGGVLFQKGVSTGKQMQRFTRYLAVMGDRGSVAVSELANTLGIPAKKVEDDLEDMLGRGYFGRQAYLNKALGYLLRSSEADAELKRKQTEEKAKAEPPKATEEGYSGILREIRRANDEIADEGLSAKIDRLESIAGRIFQIVEADPEKAREISTFFNYYLPTTQKLLDSYAKFESAGIEGENLHQAKAQIESTMDTIVEGFEHQLDQLYKGDALDIDRDIRVMETMLHRDTATVERDFNLGGAAAQEKTDF